ncbi:hypothetical protein RHGRI_006123 [Rhododendron griersonianum]|uniref:Uncharacterized protein n=1 Tax=Rhododendron griersonianum TaxID=479676 RepID=A0AAV6LHY7_9ERIC|nr:hypothetical protein RHGRI_006123 [Rhododendron griersonianum]
MSKRILSTDEFLCASHHFSFSLLVVSSFQHGCCHALRSFTLAVSSLGSTIDSDGGINTPKRKCGNMFAVRIV